VTEPVIDLLLFVGTRGCPCLVDALPRLPLDEILQEPEIGWDVLRLTDVLTVLTLTDVVRPPTERLKKVSVQFCFSYGLGFSQGFGEQFGQTIILLQFSP